MWNFDRRLRLRWVAMHASRFLEVAQLPDSMDLGHRKVFFPKGFVRVVGVGNREQELYLA